MGILWRLKCNYSHVFAIFLIAAGPEATQGIAVCRPGDLAKYLSVLLESKVPEIRSEREAQWLFRNFSKKEHEALDARLAAIPDSARASAGVARASGETEQSTLAALRAVRERKISVSQYSTVAVRWSAREELGRLVPAAGWKPVPILDSSGHLTPYAREVFIKPAKNRAAVFNSEEIAAFEKKIAQLPDPERTLVVAQIPEKEFSGYTDHHDFRSWYGGTVDSLVRDTEKNGYNYLFVRTHAINPNVVPAADHVALIFPSQGTLQAYADVRYGQDAVQAFPELGITSLESLDHGIAAGGRVIAVPAPAIANTIEADGVAFGPISAWFHDWNHALDGSEINKEIRVTLPRVTSVLEQATESARAGTFHLKIPDASGNLREMQILTYYNRGILGEARDLRSAAFGATWKRSARSLSIAEKLKSAFDGDKYLLIVIDMKVHPEFYRARGIDIEKLVQDFGEDAQRTYQLNWTAENVPWK